MINRGEVEKIMTPVCSTFRQAMIRICLISSLIGLVFMNMTEWSVAENGSRWWQREDPKGSTNQIVNPNYLKVKRELEKAWDIYQKDLEAEAHFRSLGQNTSVLREAVRSSKRKVAELEEELSHIQMYRTRPEQSRDHDHGNDAARSHEHPPPGEYNGGSSQPTIKIELPDQTENSDTDLSLASVYDVLQKCGIDCRRVGDILLRINTDEFNTVRAVVNAEKNEVELFHEIPLQSPDTFEFVKLDKHIKSKHPSFEVSKERDQGSSGPVILVVTRLGANTLKSSPILKRRLGEFDEIARYISSLEGLNEGN